MIEWQMSPAQHCMSPDQTEAINHWVADRVGSEERRENARRQLVLAIRGRNGLESLS